MSQGALLGNQWRSNSNRSATSGTTNGVVGRCPGLGGGVRGDTQQWLNRSKLSKRCFWNACKALSFGLLLMVIGGSMATIGYYADSLSPKPVFRSNSTVRIKSKGFHLNNLSYAGPIVMGIGGFIVVAACVMTFEARDSAAKSYLQRTHKPLTHMNTGGSSIHRHKVSPNRTDSSRRHTGPGNPSGSPCSDINRRALTQAFIQFSKNLHQNNLEKSLLCSPNLSIASTSGGINKSPSAPNLVDLAKVLGGSGPVSPTKAYRLSPRSCEKTSRNSLHPLTGGCALLNPHMLQRQAVSMDVPDYQDYFSPPRSRHVSRQCSQKGSKESMDSVAHGSQASMAMDVYLPNDCPVTLKIRDRTKRSDTARRHMLVRQIATIDNEDEDPTRCVNCSENFQKSSKLDVRLCTKCGGADVLLVPRKFTPKSSFDEYISRSQRGSTNDIPMKDQLASIVGHQKFKYMRSNTIEDSKIRRKSDSFYKRKSSGTAHDKILKHKTNLSKSPTSSIRSFQEKQMSNLNLSTQFKSSNEHLKISNSKLNEFKSSHGGSPTSSRNQLNSYQELLKTSRDSAGDIYLSANTDEEESISDSSRMSPNLTCYRQSSHHSYDSRQSSITNDEFLRQTMTASSSKLSSRQSSRQSIEERLRQDISRQSSLRDEQRGRLSPTMEQRVIQPPSNTSEAHGPKTGSSKTPADMAVETLNERLIGQILESHSCDITNSERPDSIETNNRQHETTVASTDEVKDFPRDGNVNQLNEEDKIDDSRRKISKPNIDFNNVSIEMIDKEDDLPEYSFK